MLSIQQATKDFFFKFVFLCVNFLSQINDSISTSNLVLPQFDYYGVWIVLCCTGEKCVVKTYTHIPMEMTRPHKLMKQLTAQIV